MRELDGYLRFDTAGEFDVLNRIWELDCMFTNYLLAQQKLVFKQRHGATVKAPRPGDRPPRSNG